MRIRTLNNIERILEFDKIKEKWLEFAETKWAKDEIKKSEPYLSETKLRGKLRETTEASVLLKKAGNPPIPTLEGMNELISMSAKGECLTASQLEKIGNMLTAVLRFKDYLNRCKQFLINLQLETHYL